MANAQKLIAKTSEFTMVKGANDTMLHKFFVDGIKDIYYAEKHIIKALPKMMMAATSSELKQAFQEHLDVTKMQLTRIEDVFELLGKKPQAKKCEAIEGITKEGETIIEATEQGSATRDVGLIMAAQKMEHYEIASYGGLTQLAITLCLDDIAELLAATLEEEKETDLLLTHIAEHNVNYTAADEDETYNN
jgi:ferritin-like metal-binding protein YciE